MATLSEEILDAAHKDGLITGELSRNQKKYLNKNVVTFNKLFKFIEAEADGLEIEQISTRMRIHPNTCLIYTRWMNKKGIIRVSENEIEGINQKKTVNCYRAKL